MEQVMPDSAPSGAVPAAPTSPTPTELLATSADSGAIVGHVAGVVATPSSQQVEDLARSPEFTTQLEIQAHNDAAEALEAEADSLPSETDKHSVGLLHHDTRTITLEKKGREGVRQVQFHTNL